MVFPNEEAVYEHFLPGYFNEQNDSVRNDLWWNASDEVIASLLTYLQQFRGTGDDCISVLDLCREGGNFTAWPDLLSYDIAYWELNSYLEEQSYDKHAEKLEKKTRIPKAIAQIPAGYTSEYCDTEIQLIYKGKLYNGSISSALHYIEQQATKQISEWAAHFPSDQRTINLAWLDSTQARHDFLKEQLEALGPITFVLEHQTQGQLPEVRFILANNQTMRSIRPEHFVQDVKSMQRETPAVLDSLVAVVVKVHHRQYENKTWTVCSSMEVTDR
ncbi:hypothetical protein RJ45_11370 [Photobacterium gaetbulicola]|uniref:Uncharacterized protein n=1 Tax=Photobacterium gaetbulicola TaxID=1295392 RepID=A0A0B9GFK6_9GAMM|nr:hypothetical protein [Photobacterium gaetbulicola]KHT63545.1 hypothetical protein RJ45_11370 [Photobacterium gaetbulicola]